MGIAFKEIHAGLDSSYLDELSRNVSEPGAGSFSELRKAVIDEKADAGFAFDCDADRFVVIDEKGNFVEGDRTILLIAEKLFSPGDAVSNVCTSLVTENLLRDRGFRIHHERWGQTFIGDCIRKNGAVLGFEPDGHFIYPQLSLHADGIASAGFFSTALSSITMTLSQYVAKLPPTFIEREKIDWDDDLVHYTDKVDSLLRGKFGGYRRLHDRLFMAIKDAQKLVIRQSPFDASLRISAEGPSREKARRMIEDAEELFK
jgi:phosphomannomutase/phosphoglucomutase